MSEKTSRERTIPIQAIPEQGGVMECGAAISSSEMARFVESFQQSTRRWELVVYPAMFAFVVLAGYGFFLIYSLTGSVSTIANGMDEQMGEHMTIMAHNISELTSEIKTMSKTMEAISVKMDTMPLMQTDIAEMNRSMASLDRAVTNLDTSVSVMTSSTDRMRADLGHMSHNVSRPMSFFNTFVPW